MAFSRRDLFKALAATWLARFLPAPKSKLFTADYLIDLRNAVDPDWPYPGAKLNGGQFYTSTPRVDSTNLPEP